MASRSRLGQKEGMCDECGLEATRRCSACSNASYCGTPCQTVAWKGHKGECKVLKALKEVPAGAGSPALINTIEADLRAWLKVHPNPRVKVTGPASKHATELIKAYGSNPDIAFPPATVADKSFIAKRPFRLAIVTISRILFIHTVRSLKPDGVTQLGRRLSMTPPYSDRFDGFTGKEAKNPAGLTASTYEWLMRTMSNTVYGLVDPEVAQRWRVLAEVGVMVWEEAETAEERAAREARWAEEEDAGYDSDE